MTFSRGPLAALQLELVDPRTTPHVWARTNALVVTVSGDVTRSELLEAARTLTKEKRP